MCLMMRVLTYINVGGFKLIYGFFGDIGSGKSLSMVKYGYYHYLTGHNVYSNMSLSFPHITVNEEFLENMVKKDVNLDGDNVFLLDEFDLYIDSRTSGKERNRLISYFIKQVRKKRVKLYYTTQFEHMIDRRLRDLTFIKVICESMPTRISLPTGKAYDLIFITNEIYNNEELVNKKRYLGNPFFRLYNTRELITISD